MLWEVFIYVATYVGLFTGVFFFYTFLENKQYLQNPKIKRFYDVSIIIPAYNESMTIARTIKSLLKLDYPKDKLKIIIVDDGSKDNTYEIAKRYLSKNVSVFTKPNSGKARSLNFALEKIDTELVGCLDADSYADKFSLKKMIGYFDNGNVMAVVPSIKISNAKGVLQQIQKIEYLFAVYLKKVFSYLKSVYIAPGPLSIYRKSFLDKYGGWDENTLTEDLELALRIQSKNFLIENSVDANVYTVGPKNFKQLFNQRMRWYLGLMSNLLKYKSLFGKKYGDLGIFVLPSSFVFICFSIFAFFYLLRGFFRSFFDWVHNLSVVNFEFLSFVKMELEYLNFNFIYSPFFILTVIAIMFSVVVIYIAKVCSNEKTSMVIPYLLYLFMYWILFAFFWLMAGIYKLLSFDVKWGETSGSA